MSHPVARGTFVHGEVSSADASAGVAVVLYNSDKTVVTLASTERLVIYDIVIVAVAGGAVALTENTDVSGARIVKGTYAANGGIAIPLARPFECARGVVPKLFAAAGQVNLSITGEIIKG